MLEGVHLRVSSNDDLFLATLGLTIIFQVS